METYYRYGLFYDGEYQGVGIFFGIAELNLGEQKENELLAPFNDGLKMPAFKDTRDDLAFLFTAKGHEKFHDALESLLHAYEESFLFEARLDIFEGISENDIVYKDEYQIAVPKTIIERVKET